MTEPYVAGGARHLAGDCPAATASGETPVRLVPGGRWLLAAARVLPRCPGSWGSGRGRVPGEGEPAGEDDVRLVAAVEAAARGGSRAGEAPSA